MQSGKLRHTISIYKHNSTADSKGKPTGKTLIVAGVPAQITYKAGSTATTERQQSTTAQYEIRIRYYPGLEVSNWAVDEAGNTYYFSTIDNTEQRNIELVIMAGNNQ